MSKSDSPNWTIVSNDDPIHNDPRLTVYANGSGYINSAADRRFLDGSEQVRIRVDVEQQLVALESADEDMPGTFSLSREEEFGGNIHLTKTLSRFGIDVDDIEETHWFDLKALDGMAVADLSEISVNKQQSEAESNHDAETETEDTIEESTEEISEEVNRPAATTLETDEERAVVDMLAAQGPLSGPAIKDEIDDAYETLGNLYERGLVEKWRDPQDGRRKLYSLIEDDCRDENGGVTKNRDAADDAAVPDPDDSHSQQTVRDCAKQVDTVQELAGLLDVSEGEARFEARQADVYGDLDDDVQPMGVSE
jgi:hypothetical protein